MDINPGDREETCGGMMEPIGLVAKGKIYVITHKCLKCGHKKITSLVEMTLWTNLLVIGESR